jgi:hypothetical protein
MSEKKLPFTNDDDFEPVGFLTGGSLFHHAPRPRVPLPPPRAPRFPRKKSLAWLRELAGNWRWQCGTSLFLTRSTPVYKLDDDVRKPIEREYGRTLLSLGWWNVPGCSSRWTVEALDFGASSRLYLQRRSVEGLCLLAYSDDRSRARSDAAFLRDFFSSNGDAYDTFIMGGPPDEAQGSLYVSDELLVELLVSGMQACPWYEPIPDDLESLARKIIGDDGRAGRKEFVERVGAAMLGMLVSGADRVDAHAAPDAPGDGNHADAPKEDA